MIKKPDTPNITATIRLVVEKAAAAVVVAGEARGNLVAIGVFNTNPATSIGTTHTLSVHP